MIYVNNIQKNLKKENINTIFNIYIYIPKKFKFKIINNYNSFIDKRYIYININYI